MNMLTLGAAGIAAVLLAVWMKGVKAEYGIFVVIAAQLFFLFYGTGRLGEILDTVRQLEQYIKIRPVYLITLLKMTGITYSAEFASGICKDAGYSSLGKQIEIFGKLTILAVSMPVLLALFERQGNCWKTPRQRRDQIPAVFSHAASALKAADPGNCFLR